jgi:hypothetical protein
LWSITDDILLKRIYQQNDIFFSSELNPVRAQHGCALVDLHGEHGVIVVGGDSGGTRLKDVRFLPIGPSHTEWRKVAEMLTAR